MAKTQDIKWYRRWTQQVKERCKQYSRGEATFTELETTISKNPSKIKTVTCEGLGATDVEYGFGLRKADGRPAWMYPPPFMTLPQVLFDDLAMTSEMVKPRDQFGANEAQARTIITKLLEAVYKELRLNGLAGPDDIRMLQGTPFTFYPIKWKKGWKRYKVRCVGRTDFSFYFGDKVAQAINLVVIEAKRLGRHGTGEGQTLAYMAMVWAERRKRKQSDCTVFGCLADGEEYTFYHLSHDGLWSKEVIVLRHWTRYQDGLNLVANYLASFLRHGLETSPVHSSVATIASRRSDLFGRPITFKC
ncbi:hypothetical protein N7489_010566 [Penicillium chrysogenum]|uniref:Uncharacterized protein n=1 Tax=Penicillium chrysogenum TaxID=5076 RepID=A0ABQ8WT92_PENCH|nr:uncharacterized protein N7489_010566 [Penicillium chrysogenum]KAJ5229858.1 hypothetical protein N7489_010566 [Penicillium chrysogenum]KAJ5282254.1 hypothetical protein N7505_000234 [Penicillium chrysogenum]KAJ6141175.1 hypothetical protein N7497_012068 [Penicillium chrysogenum]